MSKRDTTEKVIDIVLRQLVGASAMGVGLVLPNLLQTIDKPLAHFLKHLDNKERAREARRIIYYMKSQGYIAGSYEFGLAISKKGQGLLEKNRDANMKITHVDNWDGNWRIVFYDIPEKYKAGRDALKSRLRRLGFFQLQRSVWIHPLPCRDVIENVTVNHGIENFVSYIETPQLDNQKVLIERFKKKIPETKFKRF